jgi:hypothetical protein
MEFNPQMAHRLLTNACVSLTVTLIMFGPATVTLFRNEWVYMSRARVSVQSPAGIIFWVARAKRVLCPNSADHCRTVK